MDKDDLLKGWVEAEHCPVCGSAKLSPYKKVNSAPYLFVKFCGGFMPMSAVSHYVECQSCGLVIQSPRMTDERIAEYYSSGLYRQTLSILPQKDVYLSDEQKRADRLAEFLCDMKFDSHIDVGSSNNYLLDRLGAKQKRGIDLNGGFGDKIESAELVTAIHVLEHTTDPKAEVTKWACLSKKHLLIEVPNKDPLRFAHLFYFPVGVIERMITDTGFEIVRTSQGDNTTILAERTRD